MSTVETLEKIKEMTDILDRLDEFYASHKEREVELLANALTDMVLLLDNNGVIKYANPSSFRVLGYDPKELEGRNVGNVIGETLRLESVVKTTIETNVRNKAGEYQHIYMYLGELKDTNFHLYIAIIRKGNK